MCYGHWAGGLGLERVVEVRFVRGGLGSGEVAGLLLWFQLECLQVVSLHEAESCLLSYLYH